MFDIIAFGKKHKMPEGCFIVKTKKAKISVMVFDGWITVKLDGDAHAFNSEVHIHGKSVNSDAMKRRTTMPCGKKKDMGCDKDDMKEKKSDQKMGGKPPVKGGGKAPAGKKGGKK